jgi:glycerol-3-phosphate dehydrogenase
VLDEVQGERFEVRARRVINTAGPWLESLLPQNGSRQAVHGLAKAVNLVTRPIFGDTAVGLMGQNNLRDRDALLDKGSSFLFVAPWRGRSLVGTTYAPYPGSPDALRPTRSDVEGLVGEFNRAYPDAGLTPQDVSFVHVGLLPASELDLQSGQVNLARHHRLIDHAAQAMEGLVSVEGVKYTTGRQVAQQVIDQLIRSLGRKAPPSISASTPLHGGNLERFEEHLQTVLGEKPCGLSEPALESLVKNYGSALPDVLAELDPGWKARGEAEGAAVVRAEVRHAVRQEMALRLSDVVLRRTGLGTAGRPEAELLQAAAVEMGALLGWDAARLQGEIEDVNESYTIADE